MRTCVAPLLLCGLYGSAAAAPLGRDEGDSLALVQGLVSVASEHRRLQREGVQLRDEDADAASASDSAAAADASGAAAAGSANASASEVELTVELRGVKERIALIEAAKLKAIEQEDFDLAKQLKSEISVLLGENSVSSLKALKQAAVQEEDYDLAKDLKRRIQIIQNTTNDGPSLADKVKAYYTTNHEPLPWGWRSARDPASGMDYFWPVNDRTAVTWDRPTAAAAGVPPPPASATPKPPLPLMPYEVQSTNGAWSKCILLGNGTKAGSYNISVRTGSGGFMTLSDVPGVVLRYAGANQTLLTTEQYQAAVKAAKAAAEPLRPQVGDRLEVKTKSNSWVPCVVMATHNETSTYDIHVPFAPPSHRDHFNISVDILRKATDFGTKREESNSAANSTANSTASEATSEKA